MKASCSYFKGVTKMAKNWYPVINVATCIECGKCIERCAHGVYNKDKSPKPEVINPAGCIDHCHGCGELCPTGSITYFGEDSGWTPPNAKKKTDQNGYTSCCTPELQIRGKTNPQMMKMFAQWSQVSGSMSECCPGMDSSCSSSEGTDCCCPQEAETDAAPNMPNNKEDVRDFIRERYSQVAKGASGSCCGTGSNCCGGPVDIDEITAMLGYGEDDLSGLPTGANMGLGCGNPLAIAALKKGETVLDLGSGGGFDCFLARKKVGDEGRVIGVDMTPDMIKLARANAGRMGYTNVEFRLGEIEHLPLADNSVDIIISNCVINLSLDKEQVFKDAFRVLKPGGRLSASDVVATAKIPQNIVSDLKLIAGCIGGAEQIDNIKEMLRKAGFTDIKLTPKDNSKEIVKTWAPDLNIEDYIASYIIEAVKK